MVTQGNYLQLNAEPLHVCVPSQLLYVHCALGMPASAFQGRFSSNWFQQDFMCICLSPFTKYTYNDLFKLALWTKFIVVIWRLVSSWVIWPASETNLNFRQQQVKRYWPHCVFEPTTLPLRWNMIGHLSELSSTSQQKMIFLIYIVAGLAEYRLTNVLSSRETFLCPSFVPHWYLC